jgi:hypothetical protein
MSGGRTDQIVKKQEHNIKMEDGKSIMEQYLAKSEPTQEDNENAYSKLVQLPGF